MTYQQLKEWLDNEIDEANTEAIDSHKSAMNSYGAGFDRGFADALVRVRLAIQGKLDT